MFFKKKFNKHKYRNIKYIQLCINNSSKYFKEIFKNYKNKRNIKLEFITINNFEINRYAKHLN